MAKKVLVVLVDNVNNVDDVDDVRSDAEPEDLDGSECEIGVCCWSDFRIEEMPPEQLTPPEPSS